MTVLLARIIALLEETVAEIKITNHHLRALRRESRSLG